MNPARVFWNLSVPALYEEALRRAEASVAANGPLVAYTGTHTGRSPNDKFVVDEPSSRGQHPRNIVMLTADAFGVLPPIARLSPQAAMYHFLSGYIARLAGTEKGVTEPIEDSVAADVTAAGPRG